jgi:hypothetical protein
MRKAGGLYSIAYYPNISFAMQLGGRPALFMLTVKQPTEMPDRPTLTAA